MRPPSHLPDGLSPRARRGRPGHSLESILAVAVDLFNERGFEATSMEELAGRLGLSKSAIYHHVPGKIDLLRLALDRALDGLFAVTTEPGATTGPAIGRLEHVVRGPARQLRRRARGPRAPPPVRPRRPRPGARGGRRGQRADRRRSRRPGPAAVRH